MSIFSSKTLEGRAAEKTSTSLTVVGQYTNKAGDGWLDTWSPPDTYTEARSLTYEEMLLITASVPSESVDELFKLLGKKDAKVTFYFDEQHPQYVNYVTVEAKGSTVNIPVPAFTSEAAQTVDTLMLGSVTAQRLPSETFDKVRDHVQQTLSLQRLRVDLQRLKARADIHKTSNPEFGAAVVETEATISSTSKQLFENQSQVITSLYEPTGALNEVNLIQSKATKLVSPSTTFPVNKSVSAQTDKDDFGWDW